MLNKCISQGQTLSAKECSSINEYINEVITCLENFAANKSSPSELRVSLVQAIEVLPMLYEISLPNTCCRSKFNELLHFKNVNCKENLCELFEKLHEVVSLPVIGEELELIRKVREKMNANKRRRKFITLFFIVLYNWMALLLARTALTARTSWQIELIIYSVSLVVIFFNYEYSFFREFNHYKRQFKRSKFLYTKLFRKKRKKHNRIKPI